MPSGIPSERSKGSIFMRGAQPWGRWGRWEAPLSRFHDFEQGGECDTPDKEMKAFLAMKDAIRRGLFKDPARANRNKTLAQVVNEVLAERADRTGYDFVSPMATIKTRLGALPIRAFDGNAKPLAEFKKWLQLTPMDVVKRFKRDGAWIEERTPGVKLRSGKTINNYLDRLRDVMVFAKASKYIKENPFDVDPNRTLKKVKKNGGRKRGFMVGEESNLRTAMVDDTLLTECFDVALGTGLRKGELLALRPLHIDYETWTICLDGVTVGTKSASAKRNIPIAAHLRPIFELRRRKFYKQGDYLFTPHADLSQWGDLDDRWNRAVLRAYGVQPRYTATKDLMPECKAVLEKIDLHWHDLRGEAATRMRDAAFAAGMTPGEALRYVQKLMGHAPDSRVTDEAYFNTRTDDTVARKLVEGMQR